MSLLPQEQKQPGDTMAVAISEFCRPPAGTGPIHLNEVQCLGTEKSLWSCPSKNITQEDCKHTEDAAVRCNIPYMGYETLVRTAGSDGIHGAVGPGSCWHRGPWSGFWGGTAGATVAWPTGPTVGWPIISPPHTSHPTHPP